ncbi:MAG: hypothetical protein ACLPY5_14270 [Candidatus Bathyarchaeia archaeon]
MRFSRGLLLVLLSLVLLATINVAVSAQTSYALQVGAWGDNNSVGNSGVQVDIKTNVYTVSSPDIGEVFWVGNTLVNGAFIQFGYQLVYSGNYCLSGEEIEGVVTCLGTRDFIASWDCRWFWEYWPNPKIADFYFGVGPGNLDSLVSGSWHTYRIVPNSANGWDFVLDGQTVSSFNNYPPSVSGYAASIVAEEVTSATYATGNLGPVEFRNFQYLKNGVWQSVTSLTAIVRCGALHPNCGIGIPYGVTVIGPNDIIAGVRQNKVMDSSMIWGNPSFTLQVPSQVQVTLDGVLQEPGTVQLALPVGVHYVTVPNLVQVNNRTRLRFVDWTIGVQTIFGPNITINLHSDYDAEAIYLTQYKLTLAASPYSPESEGWYDRGSNGSFSIALSDLPITFVGWYDESGNLITTSTSGTILMDAPHTVVPEWRVNYAIIATYAALVIAVVFGVIFWRRSRKKSGKRRHGWFLSALEHDRGD